MRLFLEKLDTSRGEGHSALAYLMLFGLCNNQTCSHPPGLRESFEWAFPILKDTFFQDLHSTRKWIPLYLDIAICESDIDIRPLARILPLVEDINAYQSADNIVWPLLGHSLVYKIRYEDKHWQVLQDFARLLVSQGLDLHAPCNSKHFRPVGSTPLSTVLEYSRDFVRFRELLRDLAIDIPQFVEDELRQKPLTDAGWTQESLQELFDLDFEPVNVELRCYYCNSGYSSRMENSWLNLLKRLRAKQKDGTSIEEILRIRDEEICEFKERMLPTCKYFYCKIGRLNREKEEELEEPEEEGSPFLLSI